jgi:Peptidase MA superfamily
MKAALRLIPGLILLMAIHSHAVDTTAVIQRENFVYHFQNPLFVQIADSALSGARTRLIDILGDSLDYRPDIYIPENPADFKAVVGAAFPDWGAAAALPYRRLIAIKSPAHFRIGRSLRELLQHEYAHLALENRLHHVEPPRWVDEGLAMFVSAEWGWLENISMTRAVIFGSLVPLDEIEQLNRFSEGKAATAYAESYLAVKYLLDSYGRETFNIFLDNLRERKTVDQALMAATGSGYRDFEKEFDNYLKQRYNLMTFFADTIYLWIFLALVVLVGFILYFLRRKRYFRKWEDEERFESRDFDYGDPGHPEKEDDEDKPWA